MYINKISLKNFRNYSSATIAFSPGYNFLTGDNGVGKTNILEAVSVSSNIKSFRNSHDDDLIHWGDEWYYCVSEVNECENSLFEVGYSRETGKVKKKLKIDKNEVRKASEYFGKLLSVAISPEDINLIGGPPETRRRFFDGVFSKVDKEYYNTLISFRKTLTSRNRVLRDLKESRNAFNSHHVDTWNRIFAELASGLIKKRTMYISEFSSVFTGSYNNISGGEFSPYIKYYNNAKCMEVDEIIYKLENSMKKDIITGSTTVGPHRDDYITVNENSMNFQNFSSQGQRRTASISLKAAELSFLESRLKKKAVILVDDIFSELDDKRRRNLLVFLTGGNQVIFSMIDSREFLIHELKPYKIYSIEKNGVIREK
jgi:DNA replication and repair protein RecF